MNILHTNKFYLQKHSIDSADKTTLNKKEQFNFSVYTMNCFTNFLFFDSPNNTLIFNTHALPTTSYSRHMCTITYTGVQCPIYTLVCSYQNLCVQNSCVHTSQNKTDAKFHFTLTSHSFLHSTFNICFY